MKKKLPGLKYLALRPSDYLAKMWEDIDDTWKYLQLK